jgi:glycosyltransferase involved in cell wall biosynthesis/pimeloyl-ACP methyl ester carboxylesterase
MSVVHSTRAPRHPLVVVPPVRPVYVGAGPGTGFGLFHDAAAGVPAGAPVLLLAPFGNADACSYRPRRDWAQRLAAAGHPTLRLDLPGAGDSPGGPRDPERLAAWTAGVADAARWLTATTGHRPTIVGIGLGGFVGWLAAAAGAPIGDLVLWTVPSRGRAIVRELKMLSRMEESGGAQEGVPDGALMSAGHLLSAETIADLSAVDLTEWPLPDVPHRRVLLLGRDGVEADQRLTDALEAAGVPVTTDPGDGYGDMLLQPSDALTPLTTIELVGDWLDAVEAIEGDTGIEPPPSDTRAEMVVDGAAIEERPFTVQAGALHLLGILSEPAPGRAAADTFVVLVNAGALRRVGPNRMWLELARRWAARGVGVLRIDLARVDDLGGQPEDTERVGFYDLHAHYHPDLGTQLQETLSAINGARRPERLVVAGLCSGAYWTFRALQEDSRVSAGILVNPAELFGGSLAAILRERDALLNVRSPALWRKLLTGGVGLARIRQLASIVSGAALTAVRELPGRTRAAGGPLHAALGDLAAADQRLTMLFTPDEPFRDQLAASGGLALLEADPRVEVTTLGDLPRAHTLEPLALQRQTHAIVDAAIERELRRHEDADGHDRPQPLRTLHVTESLASGVLGVVSALTERLAREGNEVFVAHGERPETPVDARAVIANDVHLVALPWRRRTPVAQVRAALALRRLVARVKPDVVHLHSTFAGFVGALAVPRRIPRVYTPHGYSFSRTSEGWLARNAYRLVEGAIARRVDLVGAVSRSEAEQAAGEIHAPRVSVVANGLPELDPGHLPAVAHRDEPIVAALGRIGPARQPEAASRILAQVAQRTDAVVKWIGGGGTGEDEPGLAALRSAGVPVTGWLSGDAARDELARATALLHWSAWDAQPLAVLEAMARDVVVVASDLPANRELLGDEQVCATEEDAAGLLAAVVTDGALRDRLLQSQRARREHYGADRMAADWLAVYRGLVVTRPFRIPT